MKKLTGLLATAVVLALLGAAYWAIALREDGGAAAGPAPVPQGVVVEATEAVRATAVRKLKAVGTLASNQSVVLRPEIAGRLTEILFDNGASVEAGTPLARLDQSILTAELADAQAELELAQQEHKRARELLNRGTGTVQRRDETQAALKSSTAKVALAEARLEKSVISAPFDGTLGIRRVDVGEYLASGADIVNLEQIAPIKINFQVPERFLVDLYVDKPLVLRSEAYHGEVFEAAITAIDPLIDERTRGVRVQALAENPKGRLLPGQFVSVTLRVDERRSAIFVPEQALMPNSDEPFVFRIEEGVAKRVPVTPGTRVAMQVEILEGLAPGDLIVTAGQQRLADGVPVTPKAPTFVPPSPPDEEIQVIGN